jgi:AraC-like DNA-binding protein
MSEQRTSFRVGDSWCRANTLELGSGVRLVTTALQFEPSFSFSAPQPPAEIELMIELMISKGSVIHTRTADGHELPRAGNVLQLGQVRQPLQLEVRAGGSLFTECASVSLSAARLRELLGSPELPQAFRAVTESTEPYPVVSEPMTPALFRLLEEISNADVRGKARLLWHEAKSLELIARMTDELVEAERARQPQLSAYDVERLERARQRLVARLDEAPKLADLARTAALNETKLKGAFRTLFGTSVFAYLRRARMEEARRLLRERHLSVTEISLRVGYSNPSKFAAAFRREFGVSPSAV